MRPFKYSFIVLLVTCFTSCDDYLEVTPKGEIIPETLEDYELMLNSTAMTNLSDPYYEYFTDDMYMDIGSDEIGSQANAYFWRIDLDENADDGSTIWLSTYQSQYYANTIINNVMESAGGSVQEKQSVLGEAMTIRAMNYLNLVSVFSKAYNPNSNPEDLGVPIVTSINVTESIPPRATLNAIFSLIIEDLKQAIEWLPEVQTNRWRVSKYTAAAVLARTYLYIHDYQNAYTYASMALQSSQENKLLDYQTLEEFPIPELNSEKLWIDKTIIGADGDGQYYSAELLALYDPDDLRLSLFTELDDDGFTYKTVNQVNAGIGYAEMYLIQAEYFARSGNIEEAMAIVNQIRVNRFPSNAENIILEATTNDMALQMVLEERRRELSFSGVRWQDMKRLDQEGMMGVVNRRVENDLESSVIGSLEPSSANYTFEIPLKVQLVNPDMELNHP